MWKTSPGKIVLKNDIRSLRCDRHLEGNGPPGCQKCQSLAMWIPFGKCIVPGSHHWFFLIYGLSLQDLSEKKKLESSGISMYIELMNPRS